MKRNNTFWIYSFFMITGITLPGCHKEEPTDETPGKRMPGTAIQYSTNDIRLGKTLVGDLNGDDLEDVVTIESSGSGRSVLIYYQNSSGNLDLPVIKLADNIRGFAIGDVNGDDKNDLVVSGISSSATSGYLGRVFIFCQNTAGDLMPYYEKILSFNTPGDAAIGDVNSDGKNDIVVTGDWTANPDNGNISIFFQNINGTLDSEFIYNSSPVIFTGEIHIADMNNDGKNDIIYQSDMLHLAVLRQQSSGIFTPLPDYYSVQTSYWPTFDAFATGDINGDNLNDAVVFDPGTNGIMNLFIQNAQGSLDRHTLVPLLSSALYGVEIADIDEDGLNDILGDVVEYNIPPTGSIHVFYQTQDNSFGSSTAYTFQTNSGGGSSEHRSLAVGDVTGDGHKDVVVSWADEGLYVLPSIPME